MRNRAGISIDPESNAHSPRISLKSEVLPVPLRPTMPALWPVGMVAEAFSNSGFPSIAKEMFCSFNMAEEVTRFAIFVNHGCTAAVNIRMENSQP
jgi:hypothetical protein